MEQQIKKDKKPRDYTFIPISDPNTKMNINLLANPPAGATNYNFWYIKSNPSTWGITIKSVPKEGDIEGFPSQHTWKVTWINKETSLDVASHCTSLAKSIEGDNYAQLHDIYLSYKKK